MADIHSVDNTNLLRPLHGTFVNLTSNPSEIIRAAHVVSASEATLFPSVPVNRRWLAALATGCMVATTCALAAYLWYRRTPKESRSSSRISQPNGDGELIAKIGSIEPSPKVDTNGDAERKTVIASIQTLKAQGNALFRNRKFADAVECYSRALAKIESAVKADTVEKACRLELAQCAQNRAACNEQLGNTDAMLADCTRSLEWDPHYAKGFARRSRYHEQKGEIDKAFHDIVTASILSNFANEDYKERSEFFLNNLAAKEAGRILADRRLKPVSVKLSRAFIHQFNSGFEQDPVQEEVDNALTYDTHDPMQRMLYAYAARRYDNLLELSSAAIAYPGRNRHLARLTRGTVLFLCGELDGARDDLNAVISDTNSSLPVKTNARIKLACIVLQETMTADDVITHLTKAAQQDPSNSDVFFHRAQCLMVFGRLDECLADFRTCQSLRQSKSTSVAFHIAHVEFRVRINSSGMHELGALAALEQQMKELENAEGFVLVAQLFMEVQQYSKAEEYFGRALLRADEEYQAVVFAQKALLQMVASDDKSKIAALLVKSLTLDENYTAALELMMDLKLQNGAVEEARLFYERLIELVRTGPEMTNVVRAYQLGRVGDQVYKELDIDRQDISSLASDSLTLTSLN